MSPSYDDELGIENPRELFAQFLGDPIPTSFSSQASLSGPPQSQVHSLKSPTYRFGSPAHSPSPQVHKSVRSPTPSLPTEPLDAVGDKTEGPTQSSGSGKLSSASVKPRTSSRLRSASARKKEPPKSTLMPSPSITKGTKGTKRAVRKVGRPPKAVTPQKGKSPAKEDEAAKDVSSEPEEQEWEVERIVGSKLDKTTLEHWYKVKWKGYTNKFNTWELKRNLANCKDLVDEYEEMVVDSDYEATIGSEYDAVVAASGYLETMIRDRDSD